MHPSTATRRESCKAGTHLLQQLPLLVLDQVQQPAARQYYWRRHVQRRGVGVVEPLAGGAV